MKQEILFGTLAMLAWSIYVLLLKAALKESSLNVAILFMGIATAEWKPDLTAILGIGYDTVETAI